MYDYETVCCMCLFSKSSVYRVFDLWGIIFFPKIDTFISKLMFSGHLITVQYALRYILIDLIILINGQIVQFIIQTLTAEVHYNENKTIL